MPLLGRKGPTGRASISGERAGFEGGVAGALALLTMAVVDRWLADQDPEFRQSVAQAAVVLVPAGDAWLMSALRDHFAD